MLETTPPQPNALALMRRLSGQPVVAYSLALLMIALIAVFLGGLMIGRTPEYLGKRIRRREAVSNGRCES